MSISTIITLAAADHIQRWCVAFSEHCALMDPSMFDIRAIGTPDWTDAWADLFSRSYDGVRNPLTAAWYAPLHRTATAADLDALAAAFPEGNDIAAALLRYLQHDILRGARQADAAGLEINAAIPQWFRARGWDCGPPWACEVPPPESPALVRARQDLRTALLSDPNDPSYDRLCSHLEDLVGELELELGHARAPIEVGDLSAPLELGHARAPIEVGDLSAPLEPAHNTGDAWKGLILSAANHYLALEAAGSAADPAELARARQDYEDHFPYGAAPPLSARHLEHAIEALDALPTLEEWAERASYIIRGLTGQAAALARDPAFRALAAALCQRARANVRFCHCYLSIADDFQWLLYGLEDHPDYVA